MFCIIKGKGKRVSGRALPPSLFWIVTIPLERFALRLRSSPRKIPSSSLVKVTLLIVTFYVTLRPVSPKFSDTNFYRAMNLNTPKIVTPEIPTSKPNSIPSPPGRKPPEASTITRGTSTEADTSTLTSCLNNPKPMEASTSKPAIS